jgi:hypothetical protein
MKQFGWSFIHKTGKYIVYRQDGSERVILNEVESVGEASELVQAWKDSIRAEPYKDEYATTKYDDLYNKDLDSF